MNFQIDNFTVIVLVIAFFYFVSLLERIIHWLSIIHAVLEHQTKLTEGGKIESLFPESHDEP